MVSSAFIGLLLATAAHAAPYAPYLNERGELNGTKWTPEHVLQPHEVILFGEGRMEVVHEDVYKQILKSENLSLERPADDENLSVEARDETGLHARQCEYQTAVITDRTQTFVDWDVQMSPVVIGTGSGIDVYVSQGYSVSNSVSVSAGLDLKFIKDKLGGSLGIDYSRTWSTQTAINIKGTVPNGYSGVMITKPIKTRKYGRALKGCLGSQTQTGTFMADSFQEGSYGGVKWVSGAITMCTKKQFPLSRCNGQGNFI